MLMTFAQTKEGRIESNAIWKLMNDKGYRCQHCKSFLIYIGEDI